MQKFLHNLKSDESLMLNYQQGDSVAFEVLYRRYKDKLFNFLYNGCQQMEQVEEMAQDVWMSIIRSIAQYESSATFRTYLYAIARNRLIDYWRWKKDDQETVFNEQDHQQMINASNTQDHEATIQAVFKAINQLPEDQREVFLLQEEGFSRNEIAQITDTKPETVKSRIRYARQTLRAAVEVV